MGGQVIMLDISGIGVLEFFLILFIGAMLTLVPNMTEKTLVFGVRVPASKLGLPVFKRAKKTYRVLMIVITVFGAIAALLIPSNYILLATLMPLIVLLPFFIVYLNVHYSVERAKSEGDWYSEISVASSAEVVISGADLRIWVYFMPAIILLAATFVAGVLLYPSIPEVFPTHFGSNGVANQYSTKSVWSVFSLGFIGIILNAFIIILTYAIYRTPLNQDPSDHSGSNRRRIFRKRFVGMMGVILAALDIMFFIGSLAIWEVVSPGVYLLPMMLAPLFAMLVIVMVIMYRTGQVGANLRLDRVSYTPHNTESPGSNGARKDDDTLWKAGVIYINRDDTRMFVPKRFGVGYTLNFGHPGSLALIIALIAIPVITLIVTLLPR